MNGLFDIKLSDGYRKKDFNCGDSLTYCSVIIKIIIAIYTYICISETIWAFQLYLVGSKYNPNMWVCP